MDKKNLIMRLVEDFFDNMDPVDLTADEDYNFSFQVRDMTMDRYYEV